MDSERESVLADLLRREVALRVAPESQLQMEKAEESVETEWMGVVAAIQRRIVKEYNDSGGSQQQPITVHELRLAALRHPEIAFWVKHNRAREGMKLLICFD